MGLGDGATTNDVIFGATGFCVRAERDGRGRRDRTYTVTVAATDHSGNVSTQDVVLRVPHDKGGGARCDQIPEGQFLADDDAASACSFPEPLGAVASVSTVAPRSAAGASSGARSGGCSLAPRDGSAAGFVAMFGLFAVVAVCRCRRRRG